MDAKELQGRFGMFEMEVAAARIIDLLKDEHKYWVIYEDFIDNKQAMVGFCELLHGGWLERSIYNGSYCPSEQFRARLSGYNIKPSATFDDLLKNAEYALCSCNLSVSTTTGSASVLREAKRRPLALTCRDHCDDATVRPVPRDAIAGRNDLALSRDALHATQFVQVRVDDPLRHRGADDNLVARLVVRHDVLPVFRVDVQVREHVAHLSFVLRWMGCCVLQDLPPRQ